MRPTKKGEEGYENQAMICCNRVVPFKPVREDGIIWAVWECDFCGREAHFRMGEPNAEKAEFAKIGLDAQGTFNYYTEA